MKRTLDEEEIDVPRNVRRPVVIKPFTRLYNEQQPRPNLQPRDYAQMLIDYGYVVVPLYGAREIDRENARFVSTLYSFPEYLDPPGMFEGEVHFVKGGFGSLGNPSSFHNPFVRNARRRAMDLGARPIFTQVRQLLGNRSPAYLEEIVDRMRVLRPKGVVGAESWHRDTTPEKYASPGDLIYGGWISFDKAGSAPQRLSVFERSHITLPIALDEGGIQGFKRATSEQSAELTKLKEKALEESDGKNWYVEVPPGHMLIFQQEMVHEVVADNNKRKPQTYRLFTAWRMTDSLDRFVSNSFGPAMEVPLIKSGQKAGMWPQANWRPPAWDNLQTWSEVTFRPVLLEDREIASGASQGDTRKIIPRYMYSMNDVSIKLQAAQLMDKFHELDLDVPEILHDIVENPPNIWRERWSDDELRENFIDPDDTIYEPYSQEDLDILRPRSL